MPVRLRITLMFSVLAMLILCLVCSAIYFFSYKARISNISIRLTNRSITTASFLQQAEAFDYNLIQKIDSLTTNALKNKSVQAFDAQNQSTYSYSDIPGDTMHISQQILNNARKKGSYYFTVNAKDAIAYHYVLHNSDLVIVAAAKDVNGKKNLHTLLKILLLSILIGIIIIVIAGYIFSASLLLPIKKITGDVEVISAQNLTRRIATGNTKDEWYHLADTLNRLLNRLQESFEFQRRFIANASHELSTPLTAVSSQLDVTLQRDRSLDEYKQVMQSVYQDVRHMAKLTQTLLEFAKTSGSAGGLEISLVRIDEVVLRIPSEISRVNPHFRVSVEFAALPAEADKLLVYGNEILLLMALKNIALNGCKYSSNHHAEVLLSLQKGCICIAVKDTGKGIPQDEFLNIFQPFYRVDKNPGQKGFGLGLSLAYRIITLHKGTIEVSSELNKGSIFLIRLPQAESVAQSS